jgi:hypothetical protein
MSRAFSIISVAVLTLLTTSLALAHAKLTSPTPRSTNAGIKDGPCGGLARSTNPFVVQGGQPLTVTWQETVNHPGKFLFALSMSGDKFSQIKSIPDTQTGSVPHNFSTTLDIPNVSCNTCTIQLIQSMEEDPSAPSYYYSCADIRIVASVSTTTPIVQTQSTPAPTDNAKMGGCGLVKNQIPPDSPSAKFLSLMSLLLMSPLLLLAHLRRRVSYEPVRNRQ